MQQWTHSATIGIVCGEMILARIHQIGMAKGNPNLAKESDYPDVDDLRSRFNIDVQYMPIQR